MLFNPAPAMNDAPKISTTQWVWFGVLTALLGLFVFLLLVVRLVMVMILGQQFWGMRLPWIAERIILGDPVDFISIGSIVLIVLTTMVGGAFFCQGHARFVYVSQMPIAAMLCGLLYLALLIMGFLLPFIEVVLNLTNATMPSGYPVVHQVPELKPQIPPEYWLVFSVVYLALVTAVVLARNRKK
jgi:hypothetical protein